MKLYHGSTQIVKSPLVNFGRENLDFGKGFYTTDLKEQAEKWMGRFVALGKKCFVNVYDFNNQICFVNQSVLECVLHFIGFYEIGISK